MKYKNKVYTIDNNIGDARKDGCWALGDVDHKRPYYVSLEKDVSGRRCRVFKNFNTIQEARKFIKRIEQDIKIWNSIIKGETK